MNLNKKIARKYWNRKAELEEKAKKKSNSKKEGMKDEAG